MVNGFFNATATNNTTPVVSSGARVPTPVLSPFLSAKLDAEAKSDDPAANTLEKTDDLAGEDTKTPVMNN